ncbi:MULTISPECIES: hypothetical protein [Streptomyces]|uniref:hypothetical protein n=1 Tax=Streptomyces TaxID=1883 RepID=UPI000BC3F02F|nr:hypothetical protein [Streptomyces sp. OK228]SOE25036.1 hypothetical protein SAMN05442782_1726 [Streptomyces sp. OK228]
MQPYDPKTSLVSPEKAQENLEKHVDRLLGKAVYLQRHAHAAMLGRCVLGADSKEDCSTEGARLQLNVWDGHTRRDMVIFSEGCWPRCTADSEGQMLYAGLRSSAVHRYRLRIAL